MFATVRIGGGVVRYLFRMHRLLDDDPLAMKLRRARTDLRAMKGEVDACTGYAKESELQSLHRRITELYERATRLLLTLGDA